MLLDQDDRNSAIAALSGFAAHPGVHTDAVREFIDLVGVQLEAFWSIEDRAQARLIAEVPRQCSARRIVIGRPADYRRNSGDARTR